MQRETGIIREYWNYFKRGKSEINFILTIYNTIILIWAGSRIGGGFWELVQFSALFGAMLLVVAVVVGKYSLTKVDTALAYINPFTQDIVVWRYSVSEGLIDVIEGRREEGIIKLKDGRTILDRWVNDEH